MGTFDLTEWGGRDLMGVSLALKICELIYFLYLGTINEFN